LALARKLHEAGVDFITGNTILQGAMRNAKGTLDMPDELTNASFTNARLPITAPSVK
jgi:hypothetical protein